MAYCTHKPPCERQKGMISVVSRSTSINPISAILNRPPFNSPTTMAIFTQASRAARIGAATYPTRAQLAAITRMQEQLAPILRVQNQLESISAPKDALAMWAETMQRAADPMRGVRDALREIDETQLRLLTRTIYSQDMAKAIRPALGYLQQEHPDLYQEIMPDASPRPRPRPAPSSRPKQKKARRRAIAKAECLVARNSFLQFVGKLQNMPTDRALLLLSAIGEVGNAIPGDIGVSIHLLVAILYVCVFLRSKLSGKLS